MLPIIFFNFLFFTKICFKIFCRIFLLLLLIFLSTITIINTKIPVFASETIIFEDDFSNGFEKWQVERGNWGMWSVVGDGEMAEALVQTFSTTTHLIPKNEYWQFPNLLNYEYQLEFTPIQGMDRNIGFNHTGYSDWCEVHFLPTFFEMVCLKNGNATMQFVKDYPMTNLRKYYLKIKFEAGRIRLFINGGLQADITDPGFSGVAGKPLLRATTGAVYPTKVRFDNIKVIDLGGTAITPTPTPLPTPLPTTSPSPLPVNFLSQRDPAWGSDLYDSVESWSAQPSIARWGCALTSTAMVLNYHGITHFPPYMAFLGDGTIEFLAPEQAQNRPPDPLTPKSLNAWLKSQGDGYVGKGLMNWLAVTRLVGVISDYGVAEGLPATPKLEYSRVTANYPPSCSDPLAEVCESDLEFKKSLLPASLAIEAEKPAILEIPGHFLLANGAIFSPEVPDFPSDLNILDPFYDFSLFSQHRTSSRPLPLLSTRIFTPSFTDLSYIIIIHDPALMVSLLDENGSEIAIPAIDENNQPLPDQFHRPETFIEQISYQEDPEITALVLVTQLAKPISGNYKIKITSLDPGFFDFSVLAYDDQANFSLFSRKDWFLGQDGENSSTYILNYQKNSPLPDQNSTTTLEKITTWESFLLDLSSLYQEKQIKRWYVLYYLERLVKFCLEYISQEPLPDLELIDIAQNRYTSFLIKIIDWYEAKISAEAMQYLLGELEELKHD